jgi:hypothetical protein
MDDRTRRLGRHAAQTAPSWAVSALGPVPPDSAARRQWEDKAASIAAYREMYGYDHPDDPVGPEPAREAPDQRAAWHEAFAALGPAGPPDVRALSDGQLSLARDAYAAETAWAPPYVGKELRLSRLGAFDVGLGAIRADAEAVAARKAGDHDCAGRHEARAAGYRALYDPLSAARTDPLPEHGRPRGMGARHRRLPPLGHRGRRRTAPPLPWPGDRASALR